MPSSSFSMTTLAAWWHPVPLAPYLFLTIVGIMSASFDLTANDVAEMF